mmetsp:Transcript_86303/g.278703  ORF Transcript_86303/g.278703 Transcript_86303/m.278703 type:complete len:255 (-) Transcript_86303:580-1344(-)
MKQQDKQVRDPQPNICRASVTTSTRRCPNGSYACALPLQSPCAVKAKTAPAQSHSETTDEVTPGQVCNDDCSALSFLFIRTRTRMRKMHQPSGPRTTGRPAHTARPRRRAGRPSQGTRPRGRGLRASRAIPREGAIPTPPLAQQRPATLQAKTRPKRCQREHPRWPMKRRTPPQRRSPGSRFASAAAPPAAAAAAASPECAAAARSAESAGAPRAPPRGGRAAPCPWPAGRKPRRAERSRGRPPPWRGRPPRRR